MTDAGSAGKRQRGRPWAPGQSGNPSGRKVGTKNRATAAALALLDGEAEKLTRRVVESALAGDPTSLRLCLERLVPVARERALPPLTLPPLGSAADAPALFASLLAAVADGSLLPGEAARIAEIADRWRAAALESEALVTLTARLDAIEAATRPRT